jgi:hypothetical protein
VKNGERDERKKMAKKTTATPTPTETPDRSESINLTPDQTPGVYSGWDFLYHVLGARVKNFEVTPEGIFAIDFSVDGRYDPRRIVKDVNGRTHRPFLDPVIYWLHGIEPEPLSEEQMTPTMVQTFKNSNPDRPNTVPEYARQALGLYKDTLGIDRRRGPKPTTSLSKLLSRIDPTQFNAEALKDVDPEGLAKLRQLLTSTLSETTSEVTTS